MNGSIDLVVNQVLELSLKGSKDHSEINAIVNVTVNLC